VSTHCLGWKIAHTGHVYSLTSDTTDSLSANPVYPGYNTQYHIDVKYTTSALPEMDIIWIHYTDWLIVVWLSAVHFVEVLSAMAASILYACMHEFVIGNFVSTQLNAFDNKLRTLLEASPRPRDQRGQSQRQLCSLLNHSISVSLMIPF